ncbi:MAG TPA: acyltransferase, partial [Saccharofermentans sp.]|nr:acyltransferase [Saccharofermentans sp.]
MDIYLVYVVCALLLLVGVKYAGIKKFNDDYLSLDASKAIQGFAAIVIIFHHISQRVSQDGSIQTPINFFVNIGAYCVAIFFFCSGYGLIKSKDKKEGYMKSFLWKRLVVLLLPFFVINGFYVLVAQIFMKANFSPFTIFSYVVGLKLVTGDGWYVITSLIMYIAFFLFFRFINKKFEWIAFVGMFLMVPLYVVLCLSKGHGDGSNLFQGEWFYNTVLLMPIGMVWARLENKLVPLIKKVYWILLPVFGALT